MEGVWEQGAKNISTSDGRRKLHNEGLNIFCYYDDLVKEGRMGVPRSTHGEDEKCIYIFCWKAWRKETSWKT
jgi:hypothetical protein